MTLNLSTMLDTPNANQQDKRRTTRLREEKARDRLSIHLGCCGHAFMRLAWQSFGQKIETLYGKRTWRENLATCHHMETS